MKEELARKMVSLVQFLHAFFPLFKTSPFMLVGISLLSIQNADVRQLVVRQTFILSFQIHCFYRRNFSPEIDQSNFTAPN